MQVKLLLHVAEEMTSLSRIIRGIQAQQAEPYTVKIQPQFTFEQYPSLNLEEIEEKPLTMDEVLQERNRLLEEARLQIENERAQFEQYRQEQLSSIEQLKEVWAEEKLQLEQQAYEEAFSKGYDEGMQKAAAQMAVSIEKTNNLINLAQVNADKYIEEQEFIILDLALKAASKIVDYELDQNEEAFVSIVKRGLKGVRELENIKIYVGYDHYPLLTKYRDELAEMFPPDIQFLIFVHEDLQQEQCYIETSHGRVVVSIDEQLQELRLKLNEILESKE